MNDARVRLEQLEYDNIELRVGDGTLGWRDAAPFDAIVVAAGGPEAPDQLKRQLAIGGILVIPVGDAGKKQRLLKIIRRNENDFHREDLGGVSFVPLIGAKGWAETEKLTSPTRSLPEVIAELAEPLPDLADATFGALFDRLGERRVVLLGEASHGTSEFYRARAAITKRLVEEHGFTILAFEADWPDAAIIDRLYTRKGARLR